MKTRKVGTVVLGAAVSAAFAGLLAASPAQAACASFWGMGNGNGCTSTFGSAAVASGTGAQAAAAGIGNAAVALGDYSTATSAGFFNTSLADGKHASATTVGLGNTAVDIGDNDAPSVGTALTGVPYGAVALGTFNRAINVGGNNTAIASSAFPPVVDVSGSQPNISIGNNSVINLGKGNTGIAKDGFSNGVYQLGNNNFGAAGGVLSNVIQIGNDNHGTLKIPVVYETAVKNESYQPRYIEVATPNTAGGLGAENLVIGNRNSANARGNVVLANTFGDDNKNDVTGAPPAPNSGLLGAFAPNLSMSNVFGNGNKVSSVGNNNLTNVLGNGNKVAPKHFWSNDAGVQGNGNVTTIVGNHDRASAKGNNNLTSVFGNRSTARSYGDNKVSTAVGDDKKNINGVDQS